MRFQKVFLFCLIFGFSLGQVYSDQVTINTTEDASIYEENNNANGTGNLFVGRTVGNSGTTIRRALLKFDIAGNIPAGAVINSVELTYFPNRTGGTASTFDIHRLTSDWSEGPTNASGQGSAPQAGDVTWDFINFNTVSWTTPGGDFSPTISASVNNSGLSGITISSTAQSVSDVQAWLDSPASNFGWIMKANNESVAGTATRLNSSESASNQPSLLIDFTPSGPVESGIVYPAGTENFETASLGGSVDTAINGWNIVGGSASYTALISDSVPASGPGGGSTQWLTITDTDASGSNRVYSNALITDDSISEYTFEWDMYISALASTSETLVVSQHFNSGYSNLAGLRIAPDGVYVSLPTGSGNTGPAVDVKLYDYTDTGGFTQNSWVRVGFTINIGFETVTGFATGSDTVTTKEAVISGLEFSELAELGNLRFCIRNALSGNTSTISYDNVSFSSQAGQLLSVKHWTMY